MRGGQSSSSSSTSPEVRRLLQQTQALEAQLKQAIPKGSSAVDEVEDLRNRIREHYVQLLFADPSFAAGREMEHSMWKTCFHKKIEEYRKRIRKYAAMASTSDNRAAVVKAKADLHTVCNDFSNFITDSINFYQDLMAQYEGLRKQWPSLRRQGAGGDTEGGQQQYDPLRSIHRCLIFLGDLARYRELHSESSRKDWSQAEKWYYQAIDTMPANGNPHNQLAVVATYTEAECVAVYRYCRALLCEQPFPTAKENLALLFEKNKQNMGATTKGDQLAMMTTAGGADGGSNGEEERLRQGLLSGTITGQQAGIARATMLKMFLQRFVRLHGMLFSELSSKELSPSIVPFSVSEFLGMLDTALADLRQLLKMSAFGDGLLLHMVIICIYSALSANDQGTASDEDDSIPSLSLSLAFGVVSEIASCVRTTRQDAEHTTAKPPGSRLLGPVVVFVDWLTTRPQLWRLKPLRPNAIGGGPDKVAKTREAALREAFWSSLAKITTELQVQLRPQPGLFPPSLVWEPEDGRVLKEEHDLRGFEPLNAVYGYDLMTRPKNELGRIDIVSDDIAASWRTVRLAKMLQAIGAQTGVLEARLLAAAGSVALLEFKAAGREPLVAPTSQRGGEPSARASPFVRGYNAGIVNEADEGDDTIVFKPAYASRAEAGLRDDHLGVSGGLDDSSQLPKEMVESMLGGLLDCSDSGPKPTPAPLHQHHHHPAVTPNTTTSTAGLGMIMDQRGAPGSGATSPPFLSDLLATAKPFFGTSNSTTSTTTTSTTTTSHTNGGPPVAPKPLSSWQQQPQQSSLSSHAAAPGSALPPPMGLSWVSAPTTASSTTTTSTTTPSGNHLSSGVVMSKEVGGVPPSWSAFGGSEPASLMAAAPGLSFPTVVTRASSFTPPPPGFERTSPPPPPTTTTTSYGSSSIFGGDSIVTPAASGYDAFGALNGAYSSAMMAHLAAPSSSSLEAQQQQKLQQQVSQQQHSYHHQQQQQQEATAPATRNPFFTASTGFMFR